jgi:hypothetical protein
LLLVSFLIALQKVNLLDMCQLPHSIDMLQNASSGESGDRIAVPDVVVENLDADFPVTAEELAVIEMYLGDLLDELLGTVKNASCSW